MLDSVERGLRRAGAAGALLVLARLFWGLWRGRRRPLAPGAGRAALVRRGPFLVAASGVFFGGCAWLWRPLPIVLAPSGRALALALSAPLYAAGLGLVLAGQRALADMFNVATSMGAPLYAEQRLVTGGPFAVVRHPMYLGYQLAAVGALLLYRTWTTALLVPAALALALRARREEAALAARFGAAWMDYRRRVPAWLPRFRGEREAK
jgi:protein-S-isoprenylcysteine O-methyltransferase Ste14